VAIALPARLLERPADVTRLSRVFHALSDETRLRIVGKLLGGEQCVCNLTDALGAEQSRLSFHLKALKDAGLVTQRRQGRWSYYALNPEVLLEIRNFVGSVREGAARCC
jgi:ArsR family transcriptional regulator, arsenate/arsenite/antimonite-responsive transcriptional repressor